MATATAKRARARDAHDDVCTACGMRDGHLEGCANEQCAECGMMAGGHDPNCSKHPVVDGTTGAVDGPHDDEDGEDADDDGALAGEAFAGRRNPRAERELEEPPKITSHDVRELQTALAERTLVALKQPLSKAVMCEAYRLEADVEIGCTAVAVVALVDETACESCEKVKSKRLKAWCLAHGAHYLAGLPVDPQLALFEGAR